jgi:D-alanine-D-alanine ligase
MNETGFGTIEACKAFYEALKERYGNVTFHEVTTRASLNAIVNAKPDLVVLCSKYLFDLTSRTRTWFSKFFQGHKVAFTGSSRDALEFDSNKAKAKAILESAGIATAKFFITFPGQFGVEEALPLPLPVFIKPIDAANGNGIDQNSIAHNFESYRKKVDELFTEFGVNVLVEEVLPGREFTVAIIDDKTNGSRWVMPMEIVPPKNGKGDRILGSAEKLNNEEVVGSVNEPLRSEIIELAEESFAALGASDFGRIDIKLDEMNKPHFLEANLVPGMTPITSYFPRACGMPHSQCEFEVGISGMTYSDIASKIVELGLRRVDVAMKN